MHGEAAVGAWAGLKEAAIPRRSLAHADQAMSGAIAFGPARSSMIEHLQLQLVAPIADPNLRPGRPGMFEAVGECFLHDPVGGQVNTRWQGSGFALDVQD